MKQLSSRRTDFYIIWYLSIFRKSVQKIQVSLQSDEINWYFTWRPMYVHFCPYLAQFFLEWKMFRQKKKSCRENQNTHFMFNKVLFENRVVYEIMRKNIAESGRPQMTIRCMRFACCIPKATNIYSECVIPIAFPLQQWLQERSSMLC